MVLEYLFPKKEEGQSNKTRTMKFNALTINRRLLQRIPQKCIPYVIGWNNLENPGQRIDLIHENIQKIIDFEIFEPMVSNGILCSIRITLLYFSLLNGEQFPWDKIEMVEFIGCFIFHVSSILKIHKMKAGLS